MVAHIHSTIVDGCYRCDLNKDEVRCSEIETLSDAAGELRATWAGEDDSPGKRFHLVIANLFDTCARAMETSFSAPPTLKERLALEAARITLGEDS